MKHTDILHTKHCHTHRHEQINIAPKEFVSRGIIKQTVRVYQRADLYHRCPHLLGQTPHYSGIKWLRAPIGNNAIIINGQKFKRLFHTKFLH